MYKNVYTFRAALQESVYLRVDDSYTEKRTRRAVMQPFSGLALADSQSALVRGGGARGEAELSARGLVRLVVRIRRVRRREAVAGTHS